MGTDIRGWRIWQLQEDRLTSLNVQGVVYEPRQPKRAVCTPGPFLQSNHFLPVPYWSNARWAHRAPSAYCTCGIYAFRSLEQIRRELRQHYGADTSPHLVAGEIKLWGRVVVSTAGFRAELAYPSQLYVRDPATQRLLRVYGVPVIVEPSLFNWTVEQMLMALPTATPEMLEYFRTRVSPTSKELTSRISRCRNRVRGLQREIAEYNRQIAALKEAVRRPDSAQRASPIRETDAPSCGSRPYPESDSRPARG